MTITKDSEAQPTQAHAHAKGEQMREKAEELYALMGLDDYTRQSLNSLASLGSRQDEHRQNIVSTDNTVQDTERE